MQEATEQVVESLSMEQALAALVIGVGGIAFSVHLVRSKLRPKWRGPEQGFAPLPWNPFHLILLFLIYVLSDQVVGLILRMLYGDIVWEELGVMPSLVASVFVNGLLAVGIWTLGVNLGAQPDAYGLQSPPTRRAFARGGLMYLFCFPALVGAYLLWPLFLTLLGGTVEPQAVAEMVRDSAIHERWAVFVLAALIVPVIEEFVFRGFLQTWLVRTQGPVPGILLASLFFALLHGTSALGPLVVVAMAAGWARHMAGSLWPAISVHICHNALTSILLFTNVEMPW